MVSDTRVLTCIMDFNACHDESICSFLDLFCVIDGGVRVCVGPWRGFKFSVIFKQKEQFNKPSLKVV